MPITQFQFLRVVVGEKGLLEEREGIQSVDLSRISNPEIKTVDAFIVDGVGPLEQIRSVITYFRKSPASCVKPLFVSSEDLPEDLQSLSDGRVASYEEAFERASKVLSFYDEIHRDSLSGNPDFRILAYLYMRPDRSLAPIFQPFTRRVFSYPIVECLGEGRITADEWLEFLSERGLIKRLELKNRIRFCPKCETSHLNYVDVCPHCGDLDIEKKEFIHCFTCGRVGPLENFLVEDRLRCPFCHVQLRHLGEDYDHPLESYQCHSCGQAFIEANVAVECFNCKARSWPNELTVKNLYSFQLTEEGKTACRVGTLEDIYAIFDTLNYMTPAYFKVFLDWLIQIHRRYALDNFSMLGMWINMEELSLKLGRERTLRLVNEIVHLLRQLIRKTDISTRISQNTIWIILPKTDRSGADRLAKRIEQVINDFSLQEGFSLNIKVASFSTPDDLTEADNAETLLGRLKEALGS